MIATISSMGMTLRRGNYHIWAVGLNGTKVFFCDTDEVKGNWTEDINLKAESDDFKFVYETLANMLNNETIADDLEASLLF